jgi:hypothetical protein
LIVKWIDDRKFGAFNTRPDTLPKPLIRHDSVTLGLEIFVLQFIFDQKSTKLGNPTHWGILSKLSDNVLIVTGNARIAIDEVRHKSTPRGPQDRRLIGTFSG